MKKLIFILLLAFAGFCNSQITNQQTNVIGSSANTAATVVSLDQENSNWRGAHIIINVSAYTSGNYTVTVQGLNPVTGLYYPILISVPINSTGTTVLKIYPGISAQSNATASDLLPKTWRVLLTGAASPSMTLSVLAYLFN